MERRDAADPEPSPTAKRLRDLVRRFIEALRQQPDAVSLRAYVPSPGDSLRTAALPELVKADLEYRCQQGQPISVETYLPAFPELASPVLLPRLLYEEYRVRHLYGDKPDPASYRPRFPDHFEAFQKLLRERPLAPVGTTRHMEPPPPAAPVPPRADPNKLLPIGGGYQLLKRIGRGGFGEVWRAEAPGGVEVAVKIIVRLRKQEQAERELQAIELTKRLRHQALLSIHSIWSLEDRILVVMELADGSLRERLRACRTANPPGIPLDELLPYFRDAAEALDYLHSKQVIHRDIKPDNILLLGRHAKVADFSLAKMLEGRNQLTETTSGTPNYMPPEIWRGIISVHSDQYSLALTYAEMRLDRCIFQSDRIAELILAQIEQPPNLDPLGAAEQEVLRKALAKDPDQRYASCAEFVQALEEALHFSKGRPGHGEANSRTVGSASGAASEPVRSEERSQPADFPRSPVSTAEDGAEPSLATLGSVHEAPTPSRVARQPALPSKGDITPAVSAPVRHKSWSDREPRRRFPRVLAALVVIAILAGSYTAFAWFRTGRTAIVEATLPMPEDESPAGTDKNVHPTADGEGRLDTPGRPPAGTDKNVHPTAVGEGRLDIPVRPPAGTDKNVHPTADGEGRLDIPVRPPRVGEIRVFAGHTGNINSVALSLDGRYALSGADDRTARLWDLTDGSKEGPSFVGHQKEVESVAFSPDGRFVLTGSRDKTVRLWDRANAKELRVFFGHREEVWAVAFAPDGRTVLSGGGYLNFENGKEVLSDCVLRQWDVDTGKPLRVLAGHTGPVRSVAFAPDGKRALSGSDDGTLRLWDLDKGSTVRVFQGHKDFVRSVAIAPDGKAAVSGGRDQLVLLWDLDTGQQIRSFLGHTDDVWSVAFAPDGRRILSGGSDGSLRWWDAGTGALLHRFEVRQATVSSVAISSDGRRALSGGTDNQVRLWGLPP